jgi:hypothetical protein
VDRPPDLADASWAVVARCLASDPRDRYADGAALAAALHRLPGVPVPATLRPDPSAVTEIVALPVVAVEPNAASARGVEPRTGPDPAPIDGPRSTGGRIGAPSRGAWAMGVIGALVVAVVAAMAAADDGAPDTLGGTATLSPQSTAAAPTPAPAAVERSPVESADAATPAKEKGKGNGKGKGRGT